LLSSAGISSNHNAPDFTNCFPTRKAASVRRR